MFEIFFFSPNSLLTLGTPGFKIFFFFPQSYSNSVEVIAKRDVCFLSNWLGWLKYCRFTEADINEVELGGGGDRCQILIRLGS